MKKLLLLCFCVLFFINLKAHVCLNLSCTNPILAAPIKDTTVCQQTLVSIAPIITNGKPPYIFKYNGVTVNATLNYMATNDSTFILEITDSNTCVYRDTFTIFIITLPTTFAGDDISFCNNYGLLFNLGGTPPGGAWSGPGVINNKFNTNQQTGTYSLIYTVTKPGSACSASDTLNATIDPPVPINAGNDTTVCKSSEYFFFRSYPPDGKWFGPGIIPPDSSILALGALGIGQYTYVLIVHRIGCVYTDTLILTVIGSPHTEFTATPKTGSTPLPVTFTNLSTNAVSYIWDFGDPSSGANNSSILANPTHIYNTKGNYTVKLQATSSNGCSKDTIYTNYLTVDGVGIKINNETKNSMVVYPNPATDIVTITGYVNIVSKEEVSSFSIKNLLGQEVMRGALTGKETLINLKGIAPGVYFINVSGESQKLVIE